MSDPSNPRENRLKRKLEELPGTIADHPRNKRYGSLRLEPQLCPAYVDNSIFTISAADVAMAGSIQPHLLMSLPASADHRSRQLYQLSFLPLNLLSQRTRPITPIILQSLSRREPCSSLPLSNGLFAEDSPYNADYVILSCHPGRSTFNPTTHGSAIASPRLVNAMSP
ncbi:uncharacterized protein LACBIDRAFT_335013 [Laccaria bicolor S238N-H82]|uniref:Predicted protein n=1 Tax=Laccaria bicolor (strain S238N-H82 / ATCC MYA-4686) TaxID=486041 RepID=B0E129_LACBS|nr:uncharacterized protein LACBIDRAFT_335013 [Laccaria bicolor S238N-H82]EDQ99453.1 predicted protein [Laccaria bicolor S238N-H82]|eukprot:XP_001889908.1 predicted protein [Laccaria bicolor S238N-H82]